MDWIERMTGVSPDGGSGTLELSWLYAVLVLGLYISRAISFGRLSMTIYLDSFRQGLTKVPHAAGIHKHHADEASRRTRRSR